MRLRVLHVIPTLGPGGAERLVTDMIRATDKKSFEVAVAAMYGPAGNTLERVVERLGARIFFLNKRGGVDCGVLFRLWWVCRTYRPHVLHTHLYALGYAAIPAVLLGVPVRVHTVHNMADREVPGIRRIVHWFALRVCGFRAVGVCRQVAASVKRVYGRSVECAIVYNGVATSRFAVIGRTPSCAEPGTIVLVHVGRFAPQKNHFLLVRAFYRALQVFPGLRLWLVGDGPLLPVVKEMVEELGLANAVSFLGVRDDVPSVLTAADALVLSSSYEGLPLVVLEAMAAGRPVVATRVGGVPEVVQNGVTGILVRPHSVEDLAQGILRLAMDGQARARMGQAARRLVLERFDIQRTAKEYEQLYLVLWRRKAPRGQNASIASG